MLNPDRGELRLQQTSAPEIPKKNGHFPHWLRTSAFTARTCLALLTATPGVVIAADVLSRTENSSIVYDSGQDVTVNARFDLDSTPAPLATAQPLEVYKLYLNSNLYVIRGFRDEVNFRDDFPIDRSRPKIYSGIADKEGGFPIDESRIIDNWGRTGIRLRAGQTLEISATGRVNTQPSIYGADPYHGSCKDSSVYDPDGNHVWRDNTVCPGDTQYNNFKIIQEAPLGMFIGNIGNGPGYAPRFLIGSHWKRRVDNDGYLYFSINYSTFYGTSGGFDITVIVYPSNPTPTSVPPPRPAFSPEPIKTTVPTEKGSDLSGWLWGLGVGAAFLAGLVWGIDRWRRKKPSQSGSTGGATGSTGTGRKVPPGLGGGITLGGGSNPNLGPNATSSNPNSGPARPKNPEWIIGQVDFKRKWQVAKSKLSPVLSGDNGNEPGYVLDRFKAGMNIIQEVSLDDVTNIPEIDTRVRAGIEFLIPEIWPSDRIFKGFFDPKFNTGFITPEKLAKIICLPESYRNLLSFTKSQKGDVNKIHRTLLHALHPDLVKGDADPAMKDSTDFLLKQLNSSWLLINKLIN